MREAPGNNIGRIVIAGALLGGFGVVSFIALWVLLEDLDTLLRLMISICIPPLILMIGIFAYILVFRPFEKTPDTPTDEPSR